MLSRFASSLAASRTATTGAAPRALQHSAMPPAAALSTQTTTASGDSGRGGRSSSAGGAGRHQQRRLFARDAAEAAVAPTESPAASGNAALGVAALLAAGALLLGTTDSEQRASALWGGSKTVTGEAQAVPVSEGRAVCAVLVVHLTAEADLVAVAKAAARLPGLVAQIAPADEYDASAGEGAVAAVGFGPEAWERLAKLRSLALPANFRRYTDRKGVMPATGGDLVVHIKAENVSLCFELIKAFVAALPPAAVAAATDHYGWEFQGGRDLSGFLDGTENVAGADARKAAALTANNGSYLLHQRWQHRLTDFHRREIAAQEAAVGRTKPESRELAPLPAASHVARTRDAAGNKIPIVRASMPWGTVTGDHGLLFLAYTNDPARIDTMLDRMTGSDGVRDAILAFSTCLTGQFYYVPNLGELQTVAA